MQSTYVQLGVSFMNFLVSPMIQRLMKHLLEVNRISIRQYTLYTLMIQTIDYTNSMPSTNAYIRAINYDMEHNLEHFYRIYSLLSIHVKKEHLLKLQWEYCNAKKTI